MGERFGFARKGKRSHHHVPRLAQLEILEDRQLLAATPWLTPPPVVSAIDPAIIEAERFDQGGSGIAYVDLDARNDLSFYRMTDQVDIGAGTAADGGEGVAVNSFQSGEWMSYTFDVEHHGHYDLIARVSSSATLGAVGGYFHAEFGPVGQIGGTIEKSPLIVVPGTDGLENWVEVRISGIHLDEGRQWMRLVSDFGNVAIDNIKIAPHAHAHVGDPTASAEHEALDHLIPQATATNVAVKNGLWSSPSTWSFGLVPVAASVVWIPEGTSVTYDVPLTTQGFISIKNIRVDGTLTFASDRSTFLAVDTIIVTKSGRYVQGTASDPIGGNITSLVYFTDLAPIDRERDPYELGRGLVSHGSVSIFGQEKTTFSELAVAPTRGATSITLTSVPSNWKVGDSIVIAGVHIQYLPGPSTFWPTASTSYSPQISTQDERVNIVAINGNTVTFGMPLQYDHVPPANTTDVTGKPLRAYVANLSRSVSYWSSNTSYANNAQMHRHAHVMFMHSDDVTVNFASFNDLGRTNKAIRIDDLAIDASSNLDDPFTEGTGLNVRGRYALHFHQTGINRDGVPIMVRGNAISGGTGWGYVNHGGFVNFEDNVAFDIPGAAFVEEDGRGIGAFRHNIAIKSVGTGRPDAFNEDGQLRDMGFAGHGFFFRGNITEAEDNVAISIAHSAYAWSNKGDARLPNNDLLVPATAMNDPELALGGDTIMWEAAPTKIFKRNVAIASGMAIGASFWMGPDTPNHDGRSEIRDFTGWNLAGPVGMMIHYTRRLTVINMKLSRDTALPGKGSYGIQSDLNATGDHIYDNTRIYGYEYGLYSAPTSSGGEIQRFYIFDSSDFSSGNTQAYSPGTMVIPFVRANLNRGVLNFTGTAQPVPKENNLGHGLFVSGTKVDSLGTEEIGGLGSSTSRFYLRAQQIKDIVARGYFSDSSGTYIMIPILVTDRASLSTKVVYVRSAFNPTDFTTIPVGPNLGAWAGPAGRAYKRINAGGPASGGLSADSSFSGGTSISTTAAIDNATRFAASSTVYQTARVGASTYTLTGLTPNSVHTVRLHFAEIVKNNVGERIFDVVINGQKVLQGFDIRAAAGAKNRAIVRQFDALSDSSGKIVVQFVTGAVDQPLITGLEVVTQLSRMVTLAPETSTPAGSYTEHLTVALASESPGATIYYTTDGSTPTLSSLQYHHPIEITQTTTVRAIAVSAGRTVSGISTWVYTIQPASTPYRLNLGGPALSGFSADVYSVGYLRSYTHTRAVNVSAAGAAPMAIYQSSVTLDAGNEFWTILPNLDSEKTYTVRLHFSEGTYSSTGDRRFDVWMNGNKVLDEFDVVSAGGGKDRAVVRNFTVTPDLSGRIYIYFESGSSGLLSNLPILSGIEIIQQ